jgi:hypothetical protein
VRSQFVGCDELDLRSVGLEVADLWVWICMCIIAKKVVMRLDCVMGWDVL